MSIGQGIAIAGIWISVAVCGFVFGKEHPLAIVFI